MAMTFGLSSTASALHPMGLLSGGSERLLPRAPALFSGVLPTSADLTFKVPTPGNQGSLGSCVAWAVGYAMFSEEVLVKTLWGSPNIPAHQFSPSWIYNQIHVFQSPDGGGSFFGDALNLIRDKGAATLATMPYDGSLGAWSAPIPTAAAMEAPKYKSGQWASLTASDVAGIKAYLAAGKPIIIGIDVFPDFDQLSPANPVYDNFTGNSRGRHAVTLIGYDDSKQAFKLINSWGTTDWGIGGYGWVAYSAFGVNIQEVYVNTGDPIVSSGFSSTSSSSQGLLGYDLLNAGDKIVPLGLDGTKKKSLVLYRANGNKMSVVHSLGQAGYEPLQIGTIHTLSAAGRDIFDNSDQFLYSSMQFTATEATITARVLGLTNTNDFAKAGIMFRDGLAPDAPNAMIEITANAGANFQWRSTKGGVSKNTLLGNKSTFPSWVRLVRKANTITGFVSADGNTWTQVGAPVTFGALSTDQRMGLAVTSHNPATKTVASFDNLDFNFLLHPNLTDLNIGITGGTRVSVASDLPINGYPLPLNLVIPFDFNGDGSQDLLLANPGTGYSGIFQSQGPSGDFKTIKRSNAPLAGLDLMNPADQILVTDFNGDGLDDLVMYRPGTGMIRIARSNGNGTFTTVFGSNTGINGEDLLNPAVRILSFDLNGDKKKDLVVYTPGIGRISVLVSTGTGTYLTGTTSLVSGILGFSLLGTNDQVLAADVDGDGKDDLILYRPGLGLNSVLTVLKSLGNGAFTPTYSGNGVTPLGGFIMAQSTDRLYVGDFNGDGRADLFTYHQGFGTVSIALGTTAGTFTNAFLGGAGFGSFDFKNTADQVVIADQDGNGASDLISYRPGLGLFQTTWFGF